MSRSDTFSSGKPKLGQRIRARASLLKRTDARFFTAPDPVSVGQTSRGKLLAEGHFRFANEVVHRPDTSIWALRAPSAQFAVALHGWSWMDDLVATDIAHAHELARDWGLEWLKRYSSGSGPGWAPDIIGRRVVRMVNHAGHILYKQSGAIRDKYMRSLGRQVALLAQEAHTAPEGYPRIEALTGLLHAGYALRDIEETVDPAIARIGHAAVQAIDDAGTIPSRNPEELLDLFELLTWSARAIKSVEKLPSREHKQALSQMATILRGIRHADGGLPRFHGGGRGDTGRLDQALLDSEVDLKPLPEQNMGYTRLKLGRSSLVVDTAQPTTGDVASNAHASSLAFELTVGRRPLIVNCGCGRVFGPDWRRAGRATPSHSTLGLDGFSSSRLDPKLHKLVEIPETVRVKTTHDGRARVLEGFHDGYRKSHGMQHIRKLRLGGDGGKLNGEDILSATSKTDREMFAEAVKNRPKEGLSVSIRFHLHPDVTPQHDKGRDLVYLSLINGEEWIFRHDGTVSLSVEPSVYLDGRSLEPRATKQVVLSGLVLDYAGRVSWSLVRSPDSPKGLRDTKASDSLTI